MELWLFIMFPHLKLPQPKDCIFVIRSMAGLVDAPFRCRCGSLMAQGTNGFMSFLLLGRESVVWLVSSVTPSNNFYARRTLVEGRRVAVEWPNPLEAS